MTPTAFARNVIFAEILESMPSASAQVELVGADGGGTESQQRATVRRIGDFLGSAPRDQGLRLFDGSARTFVRGQVGAWRDVFSAEQTRTFERL